MESLNRKQTLTEIERGIREQIRIKLKEQQIYETDSSRNDDHGWTYSPEK